jgi:quercetin dioxygenase-like cupin family protein
MRLARASDARYLYSADEQFRSRPLLSNVPGHRVELYELRLAPQATEDAEAHPSGSFEQMYVIKGKLRMSVAGETHELAPGDALFFSADQPHRYEALGARAFVGLSLILYEE